MRRQLDDLGTPGVQLRARIASQLIRLTSACTQTGAHPCQLALDAAACQRTSCLSLGFTRRDMLLSFLVACSPDPLHALIKKLDHFTRTLTSFVLKPEAPVLLWCGNGPGTCGLLCTGSARAPTSKVKHNHITSVPTFVSLAKQSSFTLTASSLTCKSLGTAYLLCFGGKPKGCIPSYMSTTAEHELVSTAI